MAAYLSGTAVRETDIDAHIRKGSQRWRQGNRAGLPDLRWALLCTWAGEVHCEVGGVGAVVRAAGHVGHARGACGAGCPSQHPARWNPRGGAMQVPAKTSARGIESKLRLNSLNRIDSVLWTLPAAAPMNHSGRESTIDNPPVYAMPATTVLALRSSSIHLALDNEAYRPL